MVEVKRMGVEVQLSRAVLRAVRGLERGEFLVLCTIIFVVNMAVHLLVLVAFFAIGRTQDAVCGVVEEMT